MGLAPIRFNRRLDKSLSTYDASNRFAGNLSYTLPLGHGKALLNRKGIADWVLGGWSVNAIFSAQSGFPIAISATPPAGQLGLAVRNLRPNLVGDPRGTGSTTSQRIAAWAAGEIVLRRRRL